jgi:hypothetical protein
MGRSSVAGRQGRQAARDGREGEGLSSRIPVRRVVWRAACARSALVGFWLLVGLGRGRAWTAPRGRRDVGEEGHGDGSVKTEKGPKPGGGGVG